MSDRLEEIKGDWAQSGIMRRHEMNEIPEHIHCGDCGLSFTPKDVIWEMEQYLCASCFKTRDLASAPPEVRKWLIENEERRERFGI